MGLSRRSTGVLMMLCAGLAMVAGVSAFFAFLEYLYAALHPVLAPVRFDRLEQLCLGSVFAMVFMIWLYRKITPSRDARKSGGMSAEPEAEGLSARRALWIHESLCWVLAAAALTWLWYVWSRGVPYEWPSPVGVFLLLCLPVVAGLFIWRAFKLEERQRAASVQHRPECRAFESEASGKEDDRGYEAA